MCHVTPTIPPWKEMDRQQEEIQRSFEALEASKPTGALAKFGKSFFKEEIFQLVSVSVNSSLYCSMALEALYKISMR